MIVSSNEIKDNQLSRMIANADPDRLIIIK